jgi:Skp family chaperone for outer membrane proteins
MRRTKLFAMIATLVPGFFLVQASGGSPVAVIDFERAVREAPGGQDAITRITAFQNEQLAALDKKQKEAQDLENRLRTQDRVLTNDARVQITRDLESARNSLQSMGDEAQKKLAEMEQQLLRPIEQKTQMAVSAYASEHALKIVFDAAAIQNGLVYVHDTADITTEIIRRIAADLQTPGAPHAAAGAQPLLNRPWLKFSIQKKPDTVWNAD